jgi:hypothetical protein
MNLPEKRNSLKEKQDSRVISLQQTEPISPAKRNEGTPGDLGGISNCSMKSMSDKISTTKRNEQQSPDINTT